MQDNIFIDSNIWLYAFMESKMPQKEIATDIVSNEKVILSIQVVNEVCVNLIKKANYTDSDVLILLNNLHKKYSIINLDFHNSLQATEIRLKYKISFWDSLIIASALQSNCSILYTEDMQHNQMIENNLKIVNPFK